MMLGSRGTSRLASLCAGVLVVSRSLVAFGHGDIHERIEALTAEIRQQPGSAKLYVERGELHRLHSDFKEAQRDIDRAEELDSKLSAVWLSRARLFLDQNKFEEAERQAERFLATEPRHSLGLAVKARALSGQEKFLQAAETWGRVVEVAQQPDVEPYIERAQAFVSAGPEHTEEALRVLDEGLARLGKVPTLGLYAVDLETGLQRFDEALARLDKLMPSTGRKETWLERRGDILAKAGKPEEARASYQQALEEMKALAGRARSTRAGLALDARLRQKLVETGSTPPGPAR